MDFYELLQGHAAVFLLLLTRVGGIFMLSPFFGSLNIPVYFRAATSFAFALVLFPVVDNFQGITAPDTLLGYIGAVLAELFVGWLIGLVAYISFAATGFAVVNVMDPTSGQQMPLIGSFLYNLGIIVFVVTNGHHMIISALFESFKLVPLLGAELNLSLPLIIARFTTGIFFTGMKIAMPVTFAILLTNVGLGILARTMPQMNIFVVGIPMQLTVGMLILTMVLPFYVLFLDVLFNEMYGNITIALEALR